MRERARRETIAARRVAPEHDVARARAVAIVPARAIGAHDEIVDAVAVDVPCAAHRRTGEVTRGHACENEAGAAVTAARRQQAREREQWRKTTRLRGVAPEDDEALARVRASPGDASRAPMTTSSKPSPFTSPAAETAMPDWSKRSTPAIAESGAAVAATCRQQGREPEERGEVAFRRSVAPVHDEALARVSPHRDRHRMRR
jgi:hypothetical protein